MPENPPPDLVTGFGDPVERIASAIIGGVDRPSWDTLELSVKVLDAGEPGTSRAFEFEFGLVEKGEKVPLDAPLEACDAAVDWYRLLQSSGEQLWTSAVVRVQRDLTFHADLGYEDSALA